MKPVNKTTLIALLIFLATVTVVPVIVRQIEVKSTRLAIAQQSKDWEKAEVRRIESIEVASSAYEEVIEAETDQRCARCKKYQYQLKLCGRTDYCPEAQETLDGLIEDYFGYYDTICLGDYDPCDPEAMYRN